MNNQTRIESSSLEERVLILEKAISVLKACLSEFVLVPSYKQIERETDPFRHYNSIVQPRDGPNAEPVIPQRPTSLVSPRQSTHNVPDSHGPNAEPVIPSRQTTQFTHDVPESHGPNAVPAPRSNDYFELVTNNGPRSGTNVQPTQPPKRPESHEPRPDYVPQPKTEYHDQSISFVDIKLDGATIHHFYVDNKQMDGIVFYSDQGNFCVIPGSKAFLQLSQINLSKPPVNSLIKPKTPSILPACEYLLPNRMLRFPKMTVKIIKGQRSQKPSRNPIEHAFEKEAFLTTSYNVIEEILAVLEYGQDFSVHANEQHTKAETNFGVYHHF